MFGTVKDLQDAVEYTIHTFDQNNYGNLPTNFDSKTIVLKNKTNLTAMKFSNDFGTSVILANYTHGFYDDVENLFSYDVEGLENLRFGDFILLIVKD